MRVVCAFAAGRIIDPATMRILLMDKLIRGVSSALCIRRPGRNAARDMNGNPTEYLFPATPIPAT